MITAPLTSRRRQGNIAEAMAIRFLSRHGMKLLRQNYLCRLGEIDLIMWHGHILVFVEVRYRHSSSFGTADATVTCAKQQKIIKAARQFLQHQPKLATNICRFDVVGITRDATKNVQFNWIQDAFS